MHNEIPVLVNIAYHNCCFILLTRNEKHNKCFLQETRKNIDSFRKNMLYQSYARHLTLGVENTDVNWGGGATNCHTLVVSLKIIVKPVSFAGKGLTSWLSFVMSMLVVTFPLVSWVRCGA